jgi:hypothetical protein
MVLKTSSTPKDNLSRAERSTMQTNTNITDILSDKENVLIVLNMNDYNHKIMDILRPVCIECCTSMQPRSWNIKLTFFSRILHSLRMLAEEVLRPPRLHGLPKFYKERVSLSSIMGMIRAPPHVLLGLKCGKSPWRTPQESCTPREELNGVHTHHQFSLCWSSGRYLPALISPCSSPKCPLERPSTSLVTL